MTVTTAQRIADEFQRGISIGPWDLCEVPAGDDYLEHTTKVRRRHSTAVEIHTDSLIICAPEGSTYSHNRTKAGLTSTGTVTVPVKGLSEPVKLSLNLLADYGNSFDTVHDDLWQRELREQTRGQLLTLNAVSGLGDDSVAIMGTPWGDGLTGEANTIKGREHFVMWAAGCRFEDGYGRHALREDRHVRHQARAGEDSTAHHGWLLKGTVFGKELTGDAVTAAMTVFSDVVVTVDEGRIPGMKSGQPFSMATRLRASSAPV